LLIAVPWAIGLAFFLFSPRPYEKAATRQQMTTGIVLTHDAGNHNRYGYQFAVGGKTYSGGQSPKNDLQIGQSVVVYYDPLNPALNSLYDFRDGENTLGPVVALSLGIAAIVLFIFLKRREYFPKAPRSHLAPNDGPDAS
jgi:hypothetical protein